ncbi:MAG: ABC transporter permease [Desulfosarcinaceae bacterium]|nr:ABC transporter permease [Desulfosarcinaceae bacterium]
MRPVFEHIGRTAGYLGRRVLQGVDHFVALHGFAGSILIRMVRRRRAGRVLVRRAVVEQVYFTAVQALPVLIPVALMVGSVVIIQLARVAGQYDLGRTVVIIIVREIGPFLTALLVILRSATAVTIETSYMKVLHELEALEMAGIDPLRAIYLPRLAGITAAMLGLFVVFDLASILGGYIVVWAVTHIPMTDFLSQIGKAITTRDIVASLLKAVCFGVIITVNSLYRGLASKRQITEIPRATSQAAVESFLYCLAANIAISVAFYL